MDANKLWMLKDFIGKNKVLFKVPVYQRNYDWAETHVQRLLTDTKQIIDTHKKHFLGSIVYMSVSESAFSLAELIIIDGQQRLTTLMILLKALADCAKNKDEDCYYEIFEQYLNNRHCTEEHKIKLKPIQSDNVQFTALLEDRLDELDKESHIYRNYIICKNKINSWMNGGILPQQILHALEQLEIVEISLKQGEDDPQIIFESINSTGLDLSSADLIRNFLLMNSQNQETLYRDYWLPLEAELKNGSDYTNLDLFFTHYITYKTNSSANSRRLYEQFVQMYTEKGYTHESCLKELKYYADIFRTFVYDSEEWTPATRTALRNIRQLKQTTCYPFLFHVFDDYKKNVIDSNTLDKTMTFLLRYLLRRITCGIPSNSLRGLFLHLYARVFKLPQNKNKYHEAINKFLFSIGTRDAVPSDSEFKNALERSNLYGNPALCKFLLTDIENGDGKETLNAENLTIEHIMPQEISAAWKHIPEDSYEEYLHVLGNLSVTGYNSELSNKSFSEKKKIIQENSKAVILNSDVWNKDIWDIDCIKARGERLAKIIMQRYAIEKITDSSIEFEYTEQMTLDDADSVTGKKLVSFSFDGKLYRQSSFAGMLLDMIKLLNSKDSSILQNLARNDFSFNSAKNAHVHISSDEAKLRKGEKFTDGIFIEMNLSSAAIMKFIGGLLDEYSVPRSAFFISVVVKENEEENSDEEFQENEA